MKTKIIEKATELFLKLGFKSITMDDIANEMAISKKTIYKFFCNKEVLIEETVEKVHNDIHHTMSEIFQQNHNAIEENFEIRRTFKELFKSSETSPVYQLKKHYPEIYDKVYSRQVDECKIWFRTNIEKGIAQGLYRSEVDIELYSKFYYLLIFQINESTILEKEASALELKALEYHTRALSTSNGVEELEKQLSNPNI
ncbi:TetR/AcrR family transcriptional regulator [Flavobacterium filum]|uniref:TetR/AcrR family transcriptional regulator n=1 Tax=Flavobacterium TaxID=237 RepID=UPI0023F4F71B|nr:TetR/AcrR family transcriptional regulator [Flavobacterium filum]